MINDDQVIFIGSAVTKEGKPFCKVEWGTKKAQLDPDDVRTMALHWLEAAEAAEQDAVVFAEMTAIGLDFAQTIAVISSLRARRLRRDVNVTATFSKVARNDKSE